MNKTWASHKTKCKKGRDRFDNMKSNIKVSKTMLSWDKYYKIRCWKIDSIQSTQDTLYST